MKMKKILHYNIVFRSEPEGGFTVMVPSLPGCVTFGRDIDEAKQMIRDAIKGYLVSLKKHKETIPSDEETFFTSIDVEKTPVYV